MGCVCARLISFLFFTDTGRIMKGGTWRIAAGAALSEPLCHVLS
jgi:hypothetical protein